MALRTAAPTTSAGQDRDFRSPILPPGHHRAPALRAGSGQDGQVNITVVDVPDKGRFEARDDDGAMIGMVTYQLTGDVIVYTHTEVGPEYEGQGIAGQLAKHVMDDARERGRSVVPVCPYITKWLEKHSEYDDIVVRHTKKVK